MPGQKDAAEEARLPDDVSIVAFGDVHGCFDKLEPLLERIAERAAASPQRRHIAVSVGDLVDRGPDSAPVVDRLAGGLPGCELVVLRGNHEAMMLDFLRSGEGAENWLRNGGLHTLASYGVDLATMAAEGVGADGLRRAFLETLPARHLSFLLARPLSFACGDYFFVHAGVRPGRPLDRQDEEDLLWIRDEFLEWEGSFGKRIVHGHTPVEAATFAPNRINLDTGACFGGPLTAVLIEGAEATIF
ncbi:metallophosphoesterase family protein [Labrys monachus]|uniref:Serine/threonine protein phosphatase 1 n=1 Tax=Labrys monachus TaxID=217067 RepID=A0ABU0F729_9HYPH|nr:metallophosphoesterase family protein [Labrys monachus]MDQ0390241.1 serine/threonine protein phosphatase 1 [Labrys monachus]